MIYIHFIVVSGSFSFQYFIISRMKFYRNIIMNRRDMVFFYHRPEVSNKPSNFSFIKWYER